MAKQTAHITPETAIIIGISFLLGTTLTAAIWNWPRMPAIDSGVRNGMNLCLDQKAIPLTRIDHGELAMSDCITKPKENK